MPRFQPFLTLTLAACVSAFSASPVRAPAAAVVRRSAALVMVEVEEKKNPFAGLFGKKEETTGKVVPTKGKKVEEEELSESKKLLQQVKDAGVAGIISYVFWEWAFWGASIPVCISAYYGVTGHFPDFSNQEDLQKLGAEAFAFVNVARFAVPLRIGLALGTTPWVQTNVVDKFGIGKDKE